MREGSGALPAPWTVKHTHTPTHAHPPTHTCMQMREGSDTFLVHAYLPVEASFGLADEMRRRSSGAASASLMLSHWERLQASGGPEGAHPHVARTHPLAALPDCRACKPPTARHTLLYASSSCHAIRLPQ
jgi:hypothetical protein